MDDIQKQVENLKKENKTRFTILFISFIIVLVIAMSVIYKSCNTVLTDNQVKAQLDSLKVHEQQRTIQYQALQKQQDSVLTRVGILEEDLSSTQESLNQITDKYDKIRKQLTGSTVNNRLDFFSKHLPTTSTTR